MKKYIIIFLLFTGISSFSFGQQFGLEAGPIYSTFNLKASVPFASGLGLSVDNINKIGFYVGPTGTFRLSNSMDFQPSLFLTYKGGSEKRSIVGTQLEARVDAYYLEFPLNFVLKVPAGNNFFAIGTGPSLNFMISDDLSFKVSDYDSGDLLNDLVDLNTLETFEASWKITAGYSSEHYEFKGIINLGMTNMFDSSIFKARNNYYGIGFGYKF